MTAKAIVEHTNLAQEAEGWLDSFPRADPPTKLGRINLRTARLCFNAQQLFDNTSPGELWVLEMLQIIKEAILIDLEYQDWSDSLPAAWRHRHLRTSQSWAGIGLIPISNTVPPLLYEDIYVAFSSNNYRAARIHLHEVLLRCITIVDCHPMKRAFDFENTKSDSKTIIETMSAEICASVAFCLGDIDSAGQIAPLGTSRKPLGGYLMFWGIFMVYHSASEGTERRDWLRPKLEFISNAMGLRLARVMIERKRKFPWDLRRAVEDKM